MLLLISDANILIDMEAGQLLEKLFQLPFNFAIPDILYWEEIQPEAQGLEVLGLKVLEVRGEFVDYAFAMQSKYGEAPSTDLLPTCRTQVMEQSHTRACMALFSDITSMPSPKG